MRRVWVIGVVLITAGVVLSPWGGFHPWASGQDYGGGMGTSVLTLEPKSLTVAVGKSASAKVTITLSSGKPWGTNLEATNVPAGLAIGFVPASGNPTFTSTMTVKASSTVKPGAFSVKVRATGDDPSAVVQYPVNVSKSSYGY
jgi:hypothetical protein